MVKLVYEKAIEYNMITNINKYQLNIKRIEHFCNISSKIIHI